MNTRLLLALIVIVILAIAGYLFYSHQYGASAAAPSLETEAATATPAATDASTTAALTPSADVELYCDQGKAIRAVYFPSMAIVELSDGRTLQLPASADGSKYENADGSLIFRSDGSSASFIEDGALTYADCTKQQASTTDSTDVEGPGAE